MDEQRQISELEDRGEHVDELIDEARSDWERKKQDDSVPGAGGQPDAMKGQGPETSYPGKSGSDSPEPADDEVGPGAVPDSAAEADRVADEQAED
jgi:hypothetical protein